MKRFLNKFLPFFLFTLSFCRLNSENSKINFSADSVKASVSENKKTTNLIGNAVVAVDNLKITADSIEIFGTDYRYVNATGTVSGEDSKNGYSFKADFIKFDRKTDIVLMFGKIELNDTKNDVTISAENVEYKKKNEIMIMRFNIKILRKDIECNSMFALYNRTESKLELTGRPAVKKGGDEFKAAKISVNLETEDISLDGRVSGSVEEKTGGKKDDAGGGEAASSETSEVRTDGAESGKEEKEDPVKDGQEK